MTIVTLALMAALLSRKEELTDWPLFLNQYGIDLIAKYSSVRLKVGKDQYRAYRHEFEKEWRIGYDSARMFNRPVSVGLRADYDDCYKQLIEDLKPLAELVEHYVVMPLNESKRGAVLSYAHSIGLCNFKECALLKLINERASKNNIIREWSPYINHRYIGVASQLKERRKAELNVYLAPHKEVPTLVPHNCQAKQCFLNLAETYQGTQQQIKAIEYLEKKLIGWDSSGEVQRRFWLLWNQKPGGLDSPRSL